MLEVASVIAEALAHIGSEETAAAVRARVAALTERFPLYAWKRSPAA
jgi:glycine/serine hydroxymethyltransferase